MVVGKIYRFPPISRFIRYEVKGLMRKVLAMICDQLPEPDTHVESQGAKNLLKLRDYFLSHDMEPENDKIIRGFFNILAIIYDFDIYWSERVDEGVYLIKDMPWQRKDNQEPRYQWWLKEHDPPPHTSIVELLRAERGHAMRRHDNQVASRLKVIQNMVEGLAGTENYSDKWWIPLNNDIPIEYLLAARESLREGDEPIHGELQGEPIHGELQMNLKKGWAMGNWEIQHDLVQLSHALGKYFCAYFEFGVEDAIPLKKIREFCPYCERDNPMLIPTSESKDKFRNELGDALRGSPSNLSPNFKHFWYHARCSKCGADVALMRS